MRTLCIFCKRPLNQGKTICPACIITRGKKEAEMRKLIDAYKGQISGYLISIKITRERIAHLENKIKELETKVLDLEDKRNNFIELGD